MPTEDPVKGIDAGAITAWLGERIDLVAPLSFELITGGHSNLTYTVTDAEGSRWVLRRPPLGQVLATAHDMEREHRIIEALGPTDVPVAPSIGLCTDEAVNGAPFYVMDFVEGTVVRDAATAERLTPELRRAASESIADVLARIHSVDVVEVGLADLGRHDGYVERQLSRWYRQYRGSQEQNAAIDFGQVDDVHDHLAAHIPTQQGAAIVHGDYRLDNCMLADDGSIAAVLDWEICTLGDPLADVGLLAVYWTDPDSTSVLPGASPTTLEGFLRRDEVIGRYARQSDRDLSDLDFYVAFGFWKLTCIIAGVYARYAGGAMGEVTTAQVEGFANMVSLLASMAADAAAEVS